MADEPRTITDAEMTGARERIKRRIFERRLAVLSYLVAVLGSGALAVFFVRVVLGEATPADAARAVGLVGFPTAAVTSAVLAIQQWSEFRDLQQISKEFEPIWEKGAGVSSDSELWQTYKALCFPREKK